LYKIKQVQAAEDGDYKKRTNFCNWFLQAVYYSALDPKLALFTDEAWFHLSEYIIAKNNRY
jgi:hypothetical protein